MPLPLAIPIALMAIGAGFQAYSRLEAGRAAARTARRNAAILERSAVEEELAGSEALGLARMQGEELAGSAAVAMRASGTDVDEGALIQTRFVAEWSGSIARANARREAWGSRQRASALRSEARSAERAGRAAAIGGILGTAGSIFSGLR